MFESNSRLYNALHEVERANAILGALDSAATMRSLATLVLDHKADADIGFRLLHSHNRISDQEVMVEREEADPLCDLCLTTAPMEVGQLPDNVMENSWKLCDDGFHGVEYTIAEDADRRRPTGQLFDDLAGELVRHGAQDVIGPWLLPTKMIQLKRPSAVVGVEVTDEERRANIVRFVAPSGFSSLTAIKTTWVVLKDDASLQSVGRCEPVYECYWAPTPGGGQGHYKRYRHT